MAVEHCLVIPHSLWRSSLIGPLNFYVVELSFGILSKNIQPDRTPEKVSFSFLSRDFLHAKVVTVKQDPQKKFRDFVVAVKHYGHEVVVHEPHGLYSCEHCGIDCVENTWHVFLTSIPIYFKKNSIFGNVNSNLSEKSKKKFATRMWRNSKARILHSKILVRNQKIYG